MNEMTLEELESSKIPLRGECCATTTLESSAIITLSCLEQIANPAGFLPCGEDVNQNLRLLE